MSLIFKQLKQPGVQLGVWQIEEDEAFFQEKMQLSEAEQRDLAPLHGLRRLEWLASRWLLHELTGHDIRMPLAKDPFFKPFFPEKEHLAVSLSHSRGVVAAMLVDTSDFEKTPRKHPFSCGCDLQKLLPKMVEIAPRFMNLKELEFAHRFGEAEQIELYHFFWTAKESLYKAWGKRELDFREHMAFELFRWNPDGCSTRGAVKKGRARLDFDVFSEKIELPGHGAFVLTWCLSRF